MQGSPLSLYTPSVCGAQARQKVLHPLGWSTAKCSQATPAYAALRHSAVKLSVQSPLHLLQSASAEVDSRQGFCPEARLPVPNRVPKKPPKAKTHWKQPQKEIHCGADTLHSRRSNCRLGERANVVILTVFTCLADFDWHLLPFDLRHFSVRR